MTESKYGELARSLRETIETFCDEQDVPVVAVIGILEMLKLDILDEHYQNSVTDTDDLFADIFDSDDEDMEDDQDILFDPENN